MEQRPMWAKVRGILIKGTPDQIRDFAGLPASEQENPDDRSQFSEVQKKITRRGQLKPNSENTIIKQLRIDLRLTQLSVGNMLGCSGSHVGSLEQKTAIVSHADAIKLSKLYNMPINQLFDDNGYARGVGE